MELKHIMSISGTGKLFQYVGQNKTGIIARQLGSEKSQFFPTRSNPAIALIGITIFTRDNDHDESLTNVLHTMLEADANASLPLIDPNSDISDLREYFFQILPIHDPERVSQKDIKKMLKWAIVLREQNLMHLFAPQAPDAEETSEAADADKDTTEVAVAE